MLLSNYSEAVIASHSKVKHKFFLFVLCKNQTDECATKRVFVIQRCYLLQLLTYLAPYDSTVFFLVTGLLWLSFLYRRLQSSFYKLGSFVALLGLER